MPLRECYLLSTSPTLLRCCLALAEVKHASAETLSNKMLSRSVVALILSLPAAIGCIGLLLALLPAATQATLPILLFAFPAWVFIACASYLLSTARRAAIVLAGVSIFSFTAIYTLKFLRLSGI